MENYLTRQPQSARANSQAKQRQLVRAQQTPLAMSPQRRTTPEIPETPQGSQDAQRSLAEGRADRTQRVAPQSRSSSDKPNDRAPGGPLISNRARPTEGEERQLSATAQQLIRYTGSEARRQVEFTRGQMQKAPVLNPFLLEMEKLREHRPGRGESPFNWQRARREGGDTAQPVAAASEDDGTKLIEAQSSHRAVQRSGSKARPQHPSTTSMAARAQYRELAYLVPAPEAPIFSSAISQQTSLHHSGNKSHPRKTRPTWNPEKMATGPRSREAETASILVESHSPDTRVGPSRKKRRVEAAKENEKVMIDLTMED